MFHNCFYENRDDLIYFKKDSALNVDNEKSCLFAIDFSKVISYNIKDTQWFFDCSTPAVAINIMFEGGTEYILMKKNISLKQFTFDNKYWLKQYLTDNNIRSLSSIIWKITNE